jgi:hypothetical protein
MIILGFNKPIIIPIIIHYITLNNGEHKKAGHTNPESNFLIPPINSSLAFQINPLTHKLSS